MATNGQQDGLPPSSRDGLVETSSDPVQSSSHPIEAVELEREATELQDNPQSVGNATKCQPTENATVRDGVLGPRLVRLATPASLQFKRFYGLRRFWRNQVSVHVPHNACRDHLALERTFLGYIRTSIAISIAAVLIAQLFPLQSDAAAVQTGLTYKALAKPLSASIMATAIVTVLLGGFRFWRQQNAMVRGKIFTASWETLVVGILGLLVMVTVFAVVMGVDERDAGLGSYVALRDGRSGGRGARESKLFK